MTKITSKIEAEELREALAEYDARPVRGVPEMGHEFFFITASGLASKGSWDDSDLDKILWDAYNCFPTKEIAESCLPDLLRTRAYITAARIVDPDFVADWNDEGQKKWCVYYCYEDVGHRSVANTTIDDGITSVSTRDKADEMIELLKAWGVK